MRSKMADSKETSRVDRVLRVSAVVAAVAALAVVTYNVVATRATRGLGVGERVPEALLVGAANQGVVVLWLNSECGFCTVSMPFYRDVANGARGKRVVVAGVEPRDVLASYVQQNGLVVDAVVSVARSNAPFPVTPMIAVVKADGTIQAVWRGQIRDESEMQRVKSMVRERM